jgi:hypothetical protein
VGPVVIAAAMASAGCSGSSARATVTSTTATAGTVAPTTVAPTTTVPAPSAEERASVGAAFARFEAAIAAASTAAEASPYGAGAPGRADADGFVQQIAQADLETELVAADPDHPVLLRDPDPFTVPPADPPDRSGIYNPDNVNYVAVVSGLAEYRITGTRGNSADLTFQAVSGFPGDGSVGKPTGLVALNQLHVGADGSYTVDVGPASAPGNWLPTVPATSVIAVRDTFANWAGAVPDHVTITRVGVTSPPPTRLTGDQLAAVLDRAASDVGVQSRYWAGFWAGLLSHIAVNSLIAPATTQSGLQNQVSVLGHFHLSPGEALVVSVARSAAAYQGFELADPFGQTLPYATHESSLTAAQGVVGSDGLIHYVVSATDPGVPNWIDTEGRTEGFLFLRWQGLSGRLPPSQYPKVTVVPLSGLAAQLPSGTPSVTPSQRAQQLAARQASLAARIRASSDDAVAVLRPELVQLAADVGQAQVDALFGSAAWRR